MDKQHRISFHLDKDVLPVDDMQSCVSEFFNMVKSAAEDCLADIKWYAEIEHGSVDITVYPVSETETAEDLDECLKAIGHDLENLDKGEEPDCFTFNTITHYDKLAKSCESVAASCPSPTITVTTAETSEALAINMNSHRQPVDAKVACESFGTAYGQVKSLSATGHRPYLSLYEDTTKKRIKVFYDDVLLDDVRKSYRNKVRITGIITFAPDGSKQSIEASEICILDENQSMRFSDFFGILGAQE